MCLDNGGRFKESDYLKSLKEYFIDEKHNEFPEFPNYHRYSQRFYNKLYWKWFEERLKRENQFPNSKFGKDAEQSGVWFSINFDTVESHQIKGFSSLNLKLHGEFSYWIHIELMNKKGIMAGLEETVGYIQLRIRDEKPPEHRKHLYRLISAPNKELENQNFQPASRAPSKVYNYYSALKRKLKVKEFRYSKLIEIINLLYN